MNGKNVRYGSDTLAPYLPKWWYGRNVNMNGRNVRYGRNVNLNGRNVRFENIESNPL